MAITILPTDRLFVLTGAGISAESGIPTFRGKGGLWEGNRAEDLATPEAFVRDPLLVWRFYSARRTHAAACKSNAGHRALAALEKKLGDRMLICTQNVDHLHEEAGATGVLHMHGELFKSRCSNAWCPVQPFTDAQTYETAGMLPFCGICASPIRPHICWFGEMPYQMEEVQAALDACTVMMAVGTSGNVYPAAAFAEQARRRGARTYYVGPEAPVNSWAFQEAVLEPAGEALPRLLGEI